MDRSTSSTNRRGATTSARAERAMKRQTVRAQNERKGSKNGTRAAPNQVASGDDEDNNSSKRHKKSSVSDDLICPISRELPFQPVLAEDGRVYERRAIEKHIESCQKEGNQLKSPITNEPMGERLVDCLQLKNHIQTLIDNCVITGQLVEAWNDKIAEQRRKERLLEKAKYDAEAMFEVGANYMEGEKGFNKDSSLGFSWTKKAHRAGFVTATAQLGFYFISGSGVTKNVTHGVAYVSMAASRGSSCAASWLGMAIAKGTYGMAIDKEEAIRLLEASLGATCSIKDMEEADEQKAKRCLEELTA